jgi:hypothetical protein
LTSSRQTTDPFQLLLFDPPSEVPLLGIVVLTTHDVSGGRLHVEVKFESGELGSIECSTANHSDHLNGSLIFVYRKSQQVRVAPLGVLHATRLDFYDPSSTPPIPPIVTDEPAKPPKEASAAEGVQPSPGQETARPLKRTGLNWTEEDLAQWERKIVAEVMREQNHTKAKHLAMELIVNLPRPLRNLLRHRFEQAKWRQIGGIIP